MPYAFHFDFRSQGNGWRETWYLPTGTLIDVAHAAAVECAQSRRRLTAQGCDLDRVTTVKLSSQETANVAADPSRVNSSRVTIMKEGGVNRDPFSPDTPANAIAVRVPMSNRSYARTMWVRGLADQHIAYNVFGQRVVTDGILTRIAAFIKVLVQNGVCGRAINRDPAVNIPRTIEDVTIFDGKMVLVACPGHGLSLNQTVSIKGVKGANLLQRKPGRKSVNGVWEVVEVPSLDTFVIPLPVSTLPGVPTRLQGGTSTSRAVLFTPVDLVQKKNLSYRFARKKPGAPRNYGKGRTAARFRTYS